MVVVQVVNLVVAHQRHRFTAVVNVAAPLAVGLLGQELVEARIDVAASAAGIGFGHALIQGIHRVGGGCAGFGVTGQPAKWIIRQRVGNTCGIGEGGDITIGASGVAAGETARHRLRKPVAGAGVAACCAAGWVGVALAAAVAHGVITKRGHVAAGQFRPCEPREAVVLVLLGLRGIHPIGDGGDAVCCVEAVGEAGLIQKILPRD